MSRVERIYIKVEGENGIGLTPEMYNALNDAIQNAIAISQKPILAIRVTHEDGFYIYELDSDAQGEEA